MIQFRRPWKASIMTRNQKQKGIVRMQRNGGEALTMIFHCSTQLTADIIIKPQHFIFSSGEGSLQCQYYIQYMLCLTIIQYGTLKLIVTSYYSLRKISRYSKTAVCSAHCECVQTWINVVSLTDLKSLLSTKCCSVCCTPHTRTWITQ